jgi:hypothetical protein
MLGSVIAGGLMMGGGLVLYFTAPSASSGPKAAAAKARPLLVPWVDATHRGVALTGTF